MSDLKVSIIILANSTVDAISITLESLIEQTFSDWSGIVVGDRFDRPLKDFIERDSRFCLVEKSQENLSTARNLAIERSQHDWLLFIDAGDWLFPEHLATLTAQLSATPQADAIFCNWTTDAKNIGNDIYSYTISNFAQLGSGLFYHLCVCNQFPSHACIVKKALVKAVGNFDEGLATQAWDLWQRIARMKTCWIKVDQVLAGCLRQKKASSNVWQLLTDGLQVIARGHQTDYRVTHPDARLAEGSPTRLIPNAQMYWAGYCTGIAIAQNKAGSSLLNYLADTENFAAGSINLNFTILEQAIINGIVDTAHTYTEGEFAGFWHRAVPKLEQFFQQFSQYASIPFIVSSKIKSIETTILSQTSLCRPLALTQFYAVSIDVTQPIADIIVPHNLATATLNCQVYFAKQFLGSLDLPVFEPKVSSLVLADAIANRFGWEILRYFFEQTVYSELIVQTASDTAILQGDRVLARMTTDLNLWQQVHEKIGWELFLQELWGSIDWEHNISQSTCQTTTINDREWLIVEVSEDLNDVIVAQNSLQVVVRVGGVSIGVMTIAVKNILTAVDLKREIVAQAGFELVRAAVREGLLAQPIDNNLSLRDRLLKAARSKNKTKSSQLEVAMLSDTNMKQRYLSTETNMLIGYRQGQPIGTSASRWATLPKIVIEELSNSVINNEFIVNIGEKKQTPQQVLYAPDFILPQSFQQRSNQLSSNHDGGALGHTDRLPILMYHRVTPSESASNRWHLSSQVFEQQLRYLREQGFYSVTLEDWRRSMVSRQPLPGNAVIITFDDGYLNFYDHAFPLLQKYGFSAIVFLIVNLIGKKHEDAHLMGWQHIKELQAQGIEFGSHSLDHPVFTDLSHIELVRQAASSRAILTEKLGTPINTLAYPYGKFNSVIEHLVGACGYVFGLEIGRQRSTWNDSLLSLSRIAIYNCDFLAEFKLKLENSQSRQKNCINS